MYAERLEDDDGGEDDGEDDEGDGHAPHLVPGLLPGHLGPPHWLPGADHFLWVQYVLPPPLTLEKALLRPPGCGATRRLEAPLEEVEGVLLPGGAPLSTLRLLTDRGAACAYQVKGAWWVGESWVESLGSWQPVPVV